MSISMKANIAWSIEINNTGIEWCDLQHELAKKLENTYLHTLSTKEMLPEFAMEIENKLIEVWLKWDKFNMKLNIGCILVNDDLEGQKIIEYEESKNKDVENVNLEEGDVMCLRDSKHCYYIGNYRMICNAGEEGYRIVALDTNEIIKQTYLSLEDIYNDYKKDIIKVIKKNEIVDAITFS